MIVRVGHDGLIALAYENEREEGAGKVAVASVPGRVNNNYSSKSRVDVSGQRYGRGRIDDHNGRRGRESYTQAKESNNGPEFTNS